MIRTVILAVLGGWVICAAVMVWALCVAAKRGDEE
jgi:hypothetical protein